MLEACRDYLLLVANQELDPVLRAKGGASDLVQQTFLEAQQHFVRFHGDSEAELLAWLRRLLLNNLADFSRCYRQTEKRRAEREVALDADSGPVTPGGLPSETPTPSKQLIAAEEDRALEEALGRLPEDYRRVLLWRYREERSFEEIGRLLEKSPNAARKLWQRAVERLRQELAGHP
jgi:RNA polymerase sigma-70 factor (ECF subfamily)